MNPNRNEYLPNGTSIDDLIFVPVQRYIVPVAYTKGQKTLTEFGTFTVMGAIMGIVALFCAFLFAGCLATITPRNEVVLCDQYMMNCQRYEEVPNYNPREHQLEKHK